MQASLFAALARPGWWALALAAFLVRGGFLLVALPIVSLPTAAALQNAFGPTVQDALLGGPSPALLITGTLAVAGALAAMYALLYAGSWLELALLRETTSDRDLELGWSPANASPLLGLGVRVAAHVPTLVAIGYAAFRFVDVLYAEFTSPGDTTTPLVLRVVGQALDAALAVGLAWAVGEAVGGVAARRVAAGEPVAGAFARSVRQVLSPRGLATLALTLLAIVAVLGPFLFVTATAWSNVRTALLDERGALLSFAALLLLVSTWLLGTALLGAVLAWRATAWTVQVAPRAPATVTQPMLQPSDPSPWG
jgi:hypothetical protein